MQAKSDATGDSMTRFPSQVADFFEIRSVMAENYLKNLM